MSAAPLRALVDIDTIRRHVGIVHVAAARALDGASDPGVLQLVTINPSDKAIEASRFAIGAVDAMVCAAVAAAQRGTNVYIEGRTLDPGASGRGDTAATRYVFALVDDADYDKGKGGSLALQPSLAVETSPGNRHAWLFLDKAMRAWTAEPLGRAMRAATGSDSATAKLTQPYRVAGTPNFPDAGKRARGRVDTPTRILAADGPTWSLEALSSAFPPVKAAPAKVVPVERSGVRSPAVEALAAEIEPTDRSGRFFRIVIAAQRAGMLVGDVEDLLREHPDGAGGKYLEPQDRLVAEIIRAWPRAEKLSAVPTLPPTYPDRSVPVDEARAAVRKAISDHLARGGGQRAIRVGTGIGKTRAAVETVSADIHYRRAVGDRSGFLYAVPTHRLGEEVAAQFEALGISARVFRGRAAEDPELVGTDTAMCLDLKSVGLAQAIGAPVSRACCKGEDLVTGKMALCALHHRCGYQRQLQTRPDVWVVPHQILFRGGGAMGQVAGVIIDESFWQAGLAIETHGLTVDSVAENPKVPKRGPSPQWYIAAAHRATLARALRRQAEIGGVQRRHLVAERLTAQACTDAIRAEWALKASAPMWPGMPAELRQAATETGEVAQAVGMRVRIWEAARDLLDMINEDAVSGRLVLDTAKLADGVARVVRAHRVRPIAKRWAEASTLIMDATLPSLEILKRFYPDVEVVADIEAKAPHARVRQVLGAPVSANKLLRGAAAETNLTAIRRAIIHRFVEFARQPMLVVAQKEVEARLMLAGLPKGIDLAHFNAVAGLDRFKGIRSLILVGRTAPTIVAAEAIAGVLTGRSIVAPAKSGTGPRWFERAFLGLRMADGAGFAVQGDRHLDATAEAVRWAICEGELLQALGRARGVNRSAETAVDIDIWSDVALPVTVNEVRLWEDILSGPEAEMLAEGIVLQSRVDMSRCWPRAWATEEAAKQWAKKFTGCLGPIYECLYRPETPCDFRYAFSGARQKWRYGSADPHVNPDPAAWLAKRLGPLAKFEFVNRWAEHEAAGLFG